jgi:hypothetical protein
MNCECGRLARPGEPVLPHLCDICVDDLGSYETQLSLQDSLDLYEEVAA